MVSIKVVRSQRDVVAICDSELIGKKFEEGKLQLDVKESFFRGDEFDDASALILLNKMLQEDATFCIVGKKAVELSLEAGVVQEDGIKTVEGIPFSLVLL